METGDFLDEVGFAFEVDAEGRDAEGDRLRRGAGCAYGARFAAGDFQLELAK